MLTATAFDERARHIKLLTLDVDGVMTDGAIIVGAGGEETKVFNVRDGFAIKCWQRAGRSVAIISGRQSPAVDHRAADLGIEIVIQNAANKTPAFVALLERLHLSANEVCHMGDDLPDLPLILAAGIGATVADAAPGMVASADWVSSAAGGKGAVRELIERLLHAQKLWSAVVDHYDRPVLVPNDVAQDVVSKLGSVARGG